MLLGCFYCCFGYFEWSLIRIGNSSPSALAEDPTGHLQFSTSTDDLGPNLEGEVDEAEDDKRLEPVWS